MTTFRVYKSPSTKAVSTPVADTETARMRILEAAGWVVDKQFSDTQSLPVREVMKDDESIILAGSDAPESTAEAPEAILAELYGKKIASMLVREGLMTQDAVRNHMDDELTEMGFTPAMIAKMRKVG